MHQQQTHDAMYDITDTHIKQIFICMLKVKQANTMFNQQRTSYVQFVNLKQNPTAKKRIA